MINHSEQSCCVRLLYVSSSVPPVFEGPLEVVNCCEVNGSRLPTNLNDFFFFFFIIFFCFFNSASPN